MKSGNYWLLIIYLHLSACAPAGEYSDQWSIEPLSVYSSGYEKGTEIISIQNSTLRAVLSNFDTGEVEILDVKHPQHINRIARFNLNLNKGEELTSVAFHPVLDLFAAVVDAGNNIGRFEIHSASTGELQDKVEVGYGPDAVIFSKDGNLALVANEGEDFWFNRATQEFFTPEGSVSIIRLAGKGKISSNKNLTFADMTNHEGFIITKGGRYLEREIDWNGDGKISKKQDFDGNGKIDDAKVKLGSFQGSEVFGTENKGESQIMIPITSYSPALLEPEYIAISPDSSKAYVTLQEDDAVAVIDLNSEQITNYFGLGLTRHKTDVNNDGWVDFKESITGLREPDGITVTNDGQYFVTADEGDTNTAGFSNSEDSPASGGRSVSVFDAVTGELVGDTGNQLDEMAFANHVYPDRRSNKKGSEPEMVVSCDVDNIPLIAVGLERAGAVELISLEDPSHPKVVALGKIPGDENKSPEGIAHFEIGDQHFLLTANEMSGTVENFKIIHNQPTDSFIERFKAMANRL